MRDHSFIRHVLHRRDFLNALGLFGTSLVVQGCLTQGDVTSLINEGNISKAKDIFRTALTGFILICTAWLIINTLLHVLLSRSQIFSSEGSWFTVQCAQTDRPVTISPAA